MRTYRKREDTDSVKALKAWLTENLDAYLNQTYTKIAQDAGVSDNVVNYNLMKLIADRDGITIQEVKAKRKAAGRFVREKKQNGTSSEIISDVQRISIHADIDTMTRKKLKALAVLFVEAIDLILSDQRADESEKIVVSECKNCPGK